MRQIEEVKAKRVPMPSGMAPKREAGERSEGGEVEGVKLIDKPARGRLISMMAWLPFSPRVIPKQVHVLLERIHELRACGLLRVDFQWRRALVWDFNAEEVPPAANDDELRSGRSNSRSCQRERRALEGIGSWENGLASHGCRKLQQCLVVFLARLIGSEVRIG